MQLSTSDSGDERFYIRIFLFNLLLNSLIIYLQGCETLPRPAARRSDDVGTEGKGRWREDSDKTFEKPGRF